MRINLFKSGGYSGTGGFISNGLQLNGPLYLTGPHNLPLHAVPKQYVDDSIYNLNASNITSGTFNVNRLPAFSGDASTIQSNNSFVLANVGITAGAKVKPTIDAKGRVISSGSLTDSDISDVSWDKITIGKPTTLAGYGITDGVSLSGDTINGNLTLHANPTDSLHAVTKQYIDSVSGSSGGVSVGDIIRKPYSTTPTGFLRCNGGEVDKTIYAALYSVIGDNFALLTSAGSGKPWQQQYHINTTQSADLIGWTTETSLPGILTHSSTIVTKNRVYLLGGTNGSSILSTVYTAPINIDGTLGAWTTGTSLPGNVYVSQAVITKNRVYLLGGNNGTTALSTVYTAVINSDGTLGAWTTDTSLPINVGGARAILIKNKLYLLGGWNGSSYLSSIYVNTLNDDGTLGTWSLYSSLPLAMGIFNLVVTSTRLYLLGGTYAGGDLNIVYYSSIGNDGALGGWYPDVYLPVTRSSSEVYVTKTKVYIIGGTGSNVVYSANINQDGSLGTWSYNGLIPGNLSYSQLITTNSKLYLLGGYNGSAYVSTVYSTPISGGLNDYSSYYVADTTNYLMPGSGQPWRQQYEINTIQSTDITGWVTGTSLPNNLAWSQTVVTKNRVYLLGGYSTLTISTVYTTTINADGTLGAWTTGTSLPGPLSHSQAIITKNRVYLLGGMSNGSVVSTVYTAPINVDGTLGIWTTSALLPGNLSHSQAIVTKNRVYLMGGENGSTISSVVYTATINIDGTLGTWTTGTSLPGVLGYSQVVMTKNRVYLLGGYTGGASYTSVVYTATINSDGTLGAWTTGTSLPLGFCHSNILVTKNRVYLLSGFINGTTGVSTVYTAPINADGTLGTWTTGTSLPGALGNSQVIVTNNRVYLLGGNNGSYISTVYTAPISGGINNYSSYYDGTIEPVPVIVSNTFRLPDHNVSDKDLSENIYSYIKY